MPDRIHGVDSNLPWPVASLIGREDEIAAASKLLQREDVRLVTFTGPGGVGKTQLALAVARKLNEDFADGIVLVPLAPLRDPALVAPAIAQNFGVRDSSTRPLLEGLRVALREREHLLVLDNFEHITSAAPVVVDLLMACPRLKVLVTSRELLHLSGEHAFDVPPLELPDPTRSLSVEELRRSNAVHLFVMRAKEAKADFALTDANAESITEICRSLDGLPLAIELAAAQVRVLTLSDLREQLTNRLQILTGGHRDAPERLQTMRRAIGWSFDLLTPVEQTLFRRLSVFVGGFTLDGAEAVMTGDSVLESLSSLVDKSLVQQSAQPDGETRFSLLETIREYGLERLEASGEAANVRARHAAYILVLMEQADRGPSASVREATSQRREAELPNLRAALSWAEQHNAELLLRLTVALESFWGSRGSLEENHAWLERAVAATVRIPSSLRGLRAHLLGISANVEVWRGAFERAAALLDEGGTLACQAGDARAIAMVEHVLGQLSMQRGDWDCAETHLKEALERWRALDDSQWEIVALYMLGRVAGLRGEQQESQIWFSDCLDLARSSGVLVPVAFTLEALGTCALERGNHHEAANLFAEALTLAQDRNVPRTVAKCLQGLGAVAAIDGKAEQATRLFGASEGIKERLGLGEGPEAERLRLEREIAPARNRLPGDVFAAAWTAGRELSIDQAIAEALEVASDFTWANTQGPETPAGLSVRELDVLRLLVEGLSDKEIGETLGISRRTVSKHVESILSKLDVPSRTAAATHASRHGLV